MNLKPKRLTYSLFPIGHSLRPDLQAITYSLPDFDSFENQMPISSLTPKLPSYGPFTPVKLPTQKCSQTKLSILHFFSARQGRPRLLKTLALFSIAILFGASLYGQSSTCVPPVDNGPNDLWSEECYLNNTCGLQGNPCTANDVTLINIYIADAFGNPVAPCNVGDMQTVLLWGTFLNSTGTSRYAIRSRTEVFINGVFTTEFNNCSFDVLLSGQQASALLGTITYTCGDELSLKNTWIAWNTSSSQCSNPLGANYAFDCGDYPLQNALEI